MTNLRPKREILAERLEVVLAIGEANAERQRAQALAGGAEIHRLRAEEAEGVDHAAEADRADASEAAEAAFDAADTRLAELDRRLAEIDGELREADRQGED